MTTHQQLANSTLQILSANSLGSGFHFIDKRFAITNYHVVKPSILNSTCPVIGMTEDGRKYEYDIVEYSDDSHFDFALLKCKTNIETDRIILQPKVLSPIERGTEVLFSGFPHGIPHLLVNRGIVSGLHSDHSFYLDGIVNDAEAIRLADPLVTHTGCAECLSCVRACVFLLANGQRHVYVGSLHSSRAKRDHRRKHQSFHLNLLV